MKTTILFLIIFLSLTIREVCAQSSCGPVFYTGNSTNMDLVQLDSTMYGYDTAKIYIDVNADGQNDFYLYASYYHVSMAVSSIAGIYRLDSRVKFYADTLEPVCMSMGDSISDCNYWAGSFQNYYFADVIIEPAYVVSGHWQSQPNGYLAFKMDCSEGTYFGWVHVYAVATEQMSMLTVYDYAVTDAITNVGSFSSVSPSICIYPNPANNEIQINAPLSGNDILGIYNSSGQLVIAEIVAGNNSLTISTKELNTGIYFLLIKDSGGQIIRESFAVVH